MDTISHCLCVFAGDFLQEVANLARNVSPRTRDLMDVVEANRAKNDLLYLKQSGIPYYVEGKATCNWRLLRLTLQTDVPTMSVIVTV